MKNVEVDEARIARFKAIIHSMTKAERERPDIINGSRRKRIAAGSGTAIQEVNQLLKQYEQTKGMVKSMKGGKVNPNMPFGGGGKPKTKYRYR